MTATNYSLSITYIGTGQFCLNLQFGGKRPPITHVFSFNQTLDLRNKCSLSDLYHSAEYRALTNPARVGGPLFTTTYNGSTVDLYEQTVNKGAAFGYPPLDGSSLIPAGYIPDGGGGGGSGGGGGIIADVVGTANVSSLSGLAVVIDGVTLSVTGTVVLLTGQSTQAQNGLWVVEPSAWTRPTSFANAAHASGTMVYITNGTTYSGTNWICTSLAPNDIIGTNNLTFVESSTAVTYGTTAGTAAQGNDSRIVNAVPNTAQVVAGTGLSGGGAFSAGNPTLSANFGTSAGTIAQGNDSRIVNAVPNTTTVSAGTGLTGGGALSTNVSLAVAYGTTSGTATQGNDSRVVNAVPNTTTVSAGTGLTGGGALSGNISLAVAYGTTAGTATQGNDSRVVNAVPNTTTVSAGTGLTGGGALSGNISLAVAYGTSAGTATQGNDSRVVNAVQNTAQVVAGTGLTGGGAFSSGNPTLAVSYGTSSGTAAQGNDSRITGAEQTSNKNASNGYAGLSSGLLTGSQIPYGTTSNTACQGNDNRLIALITSGTQAISPNTTVTLATQTLSATQLAKGYVNSTDFATSGIAVWEGRTFDSTIDGVQYWIETSGTSNQVVLKAHNNNQSATRNIAWQLRAVTT